MIVTYNTVRQIAEKTGTTTLIVSCALTPCHEHRAVRAVGKEKVEEIIREARKYVERGVA